MEQKERYADTDFINSVLKDIQGTCPVFPTCISLSVKIRDALDEYDFTITQIADMVKFEPMIASRLVGLANSALYCTSDNQVKDLKSAIMRVGTAVVRAVSYAVCSQQLIASPAMAPVREEAEQLWKHAVSVASWSYAVAKQSKHVKEEEALLSAIFQNVGRQYLLFRATEKKELVKNKDVLSETIESNHVKVGNAILDALGVAGVSGVLVNTGIYTGEVPASSVEECVQCAEIFSNEKSPFSSVKDVESEFIYRHLRTRYEANTDNCVVASMLESQQHAFRIL